jgi:hypothetical protein
LAKSGKYPGADILNPEMVVNAEMFQNSIAGDKKARNKRS